MEDLARRMAMLSLHNGYVVRKQYRRLKGGNAKPVFSEPVTLASHGDGNEAGLPDRRNSDFSQGASCPGFSIELPAKLTSG